jgi:hypothetical protein
MSDAVGFLQGPWACAAWRGDGLGGSALRLSSHRTGGTAVREALRARAQVRRSSQARGPGRHCHSCDATGGEACCGQVKAVSEVLGLVRQPRSGSLPRRPTPDPQPCRSERRLGSLAEPPVRRCVDALAAQPAATGHSWGPRHQHLRSAVRPQSESHGRRAPRGKLRPMGRTRRA